MKKYFILGLLTSFGLVSCQSTMKHSYYDLDMRETVSISSKVGEKVQLKLTSNPTTGYDWYSNYDEVNENIILTSEFKSISTTNDTIVGAPSYKVYTIEGLKAGTYNIELDYKRAWEKNIKPIKQKTVLFTVK